MYSFRYPDVTHNNIEQKNLLRPMYSGGYTQSQILNNETQRNVSDLEQNMAMLHLYKPPPPYPSNRISSNSTPDLAGMLYIKSSSNFLTF